ncbi:MAG: nuclease [Methanobrevibacter sp.]|jgi:hypothetical protein|nr:nuclease [Candidatus Methanoflexus mossambicus]
MFEDEKDDKIYNLLISKGIDKNDEYHKFLEAIYSKSDFLWKESFTTSITTVNESFFEKIDVIIILSGIYNQNKENKEKIDGMVKAGKKHDIPIILVRPYGSEIVPESLEKEAISIVGWNGNCIVTTIKDAINGDLDF